MVSWLGRSGLGWLCFRVSGFGVSLDHTGSSVTLRHSLGWLLLWFQRNLRAVAGPATAQPGSFSIRPVGSPATFRKSETRTLSRHAHEQTEYAGRASRGGNEAGSADLRFRF